MKNSKKRYLISIWQWLYVYYYTITSYIFIIDCHNVRHPHIVLYIYTYFIGGFQLIIRLVFRGLVGTVYFLEITKSLK